MKTPVKDLIKLADGYIPDFTNQDGTINEEKKRDIARHFVRNVGEGELGAAEALIILSLLNALEEDELMMGVIRINLGSYPQFKTVQRALGRRMKDVPMACLLDSYVIDDFIQSYLKGSISFDELVLRMAMLGRVPTSDYLRMSPKERRKLETDVPFHLVF